MAVSVAVAVAGSLLSITKYCSRSSCFVSGSRTPGTDCHYGSTHESKYLVFMSLKMISVLSSPDLNKRISIT